MAEEFDTPQSRNEALLQNILGANNAILPPESQNEKLLQAILGVEGVEPELPPQSRIEELLYLIYLQGGGGGNSPFELYKTSARYKQGDTITEDERDELNGNKSNIVVFYAEADGITMNAIRTATLYDGRGYKFTRYASSDFGQILFEDASSCIILGVGARKDGVNLPSPTIWFEYYKLKD